MTFTKQYPLKCIYIIRMHGSDYYKIGVTTNFIQRIRSLQHSNPILLMPVWQSDYCDGSLVHRVECYIHSDYRHRRLSSPHQREWFHLSQQEVKQIRAQIESDLLSGLHNGLL
jgi:hypothetical protein